MCAQPYQGTKKNEITLGHNLYKLEVITYEGRRMEWQKIQWSRVSENMGRTSH